MSTPPRGGITDRMREVWMNSCCRSASVIGVRRNGVAVGGPTQTFGPGGVIAAARGSRGGVRFEILISWNARSAIYRGIYDVGGCGASIHRKIWLGTLLSQRVEI